MKLFCTITIKQKIGAMYKMKNDYTELLSEWNEKEIECKTSQK